MGRIFKFSLAVIALLVVVTMCNRSLSPVPTPAPTRPAPGALYAVRDREMRRILNEGRGPDWLALSLRNQSHVARLCAQISGRHDTETFREFLSRFYESAKQANYQAKLHMPIANVAAFATTKDLTRNDEGNIPGAPWLYDQIPLQRMFGKETMWRDEGSIPNEPWR